MFGEITIKASPPIYDLSCQSSLFFSFENYITNLTRYGFYVCLTNTLQVFFWHKSHLIDSISSIFVIHVFFYLLCFFITFCHNYCTRALYAFCAYVSPIHCLLQIFDYMSHTQILGFILFHLDSSSCDCLNLIFITYVT